MFAGIAGRQQHHKQPRHDGRGSTKHIHSCFFASKTLKQLAAKKNHDIFAYASEYKLHYHMGNLNKLLEAFFSSKKNQIHD